MRNTFTLNTFTLIAGLLFFGFGMSASVDGQILTPERFVQFSSIDFGTGVATLTNFGPNDVPLDGWRFCSHDENQLRQYSPTTGLNGVVLGSGESIAFHFNNDASGAGAMNVSAVGGAFAQPLDQLPVSSGAYGLQIYFAGPFGNGNNIADHLQWSYNGVDNTNADDRSDEAQAGGVWADQSEWISVDETTRAILLDPAAVNNENNSPADYSLVAAGSNAVEPVDLTIFRGVLVSGGLTETIQSDDSTLAVNPGFTLNPTEPPVWVIHDSGLPLADPVGLEVSIEAQVNTFGLTQTIEAFNWTTGAFEELDSRAGSFNVDSVATINLDVVDNVDPATGEIRVRTGWQATGFVLLFPWQASIDQVQWQAEY